MLFTVKKENIIEGLQKAAGIIPTRAGAAYLRSLWIKAEGEVLTIMATDANIEFTGTYPAEVKEPGLVGVNGRNLWISSAVFPPVNCVSGLTTLRAR